MNRKNVLLASGCSYTDPRFITPDKNIPESESGPWPMWPEILGKRYNMAVINKGLSGAANKYIFDSIVDEIHTNENIKKVVVVWSSWDRFKTMAHIEHFPLAAATDLYHKDFIRNREIYQYEVDYTDFFFSGKYDIGKWVNDAVNSFFRYVYTLATILESKNISYAFYQGCSAFPIGLLTEIKNPIQYKESDLLFEIASSSYYNTLRKNRNVIGFPFIKIAGGFNLDHMIGNSEDVRVSELDTHPNAKGQIEFANYIEGNCNGLFDK